MPSEDCTVAEPSEAQPRDELSVYPRRNINITIRHEGFLLFNHEIILHLWWDKPRSGQEAVWLHFFAVQQTYTFIVGSREKGGGGGGGGGGGEEGGGHHQPRLSMVQI